MKIKNKKKMSKRNRDNWDGHEEFETDKMICQFRRATAGSGDIAHIEDKIRSVRVDLLWETWVFLKHYGVENVSFDVETTTLVCDVRGDSFILHCIIQYWGKCSREYPDGYLDCKFNHARDDKWHSMLITESSTDFERFFMDLIRMIRAKIHSRQ